MKKYLQAVAIAAMAVSLVFTSANAVYAAEVAEEVQAGDEELIADEAMAELAEGDDAIVPISDEEGQVVADAQGVSMQDGNQVLTVIPDDSVPVGFHKTTTTYQGTSVEAAQLDNGNILLLYVTDANGGNGKIKQYNEATGEVSELRMIKGVDDSFIIISQSDESVVVPDGFTRVDLEWDGQILPAYMSSMTESLPGSNGAPSDFILIYAISNTGSQGFYVYDQTERTYQRYVNLTGAAASSSKGGIFDIAAVKDGDRDALVRLIIFGTMALLLVVMLILVIVLGVKLKDYSGYDYIDEDEYNAYNGYGNNSDEDDDEDDEEIERAPSRQSQMPRYEEPSRQSQMPRYEEPSRQSQMPRHEEPSRQSQMPRREEPSRQSQRQQATRTEQQRPARRSLLETGDIADLDDILNDPNLTSNLPLPSQIEAEARKMAAASNTGAGYANDAPVRKPESKPVPKKKEDNFEDMQVTVDSFSAGMPALVDTDMIGESIGEKSSKKKENPEPNPYEQFRREEAAEDQYRKSYEMDNEYGEDEDDDEDEYYYMSRAEKKERKALEKQRRREAKEAEKDAKYLEKERKKAEKRNKKYGYDEPSSMDWSQLQTDMREESTADSRRPMGNNTESLPSYVRNDISGNSSRQQSEAINDDEQAAPKREYSEEERANAAADAVIRAAKGNTASTADEEAIRKERDYQEYRSKARNQYEEFRLQDEAEMEEEARRRDEEIRRRGSEAKKQPQTNNSAANPQPVEEPSATAVPAKPQFKEDLDEDFEFEFLNIKRPE